MKYAAPAAIMMGNNRKIHEAEAMLTPRRNMTSVMYMGCLEYRYSPLVTGVSGGVLAQFIMTYNNVTSPIRVIGRPV